MSRVATFWAACCLSVCVKIASAQTPSFDLQLVKIDAKDKVCATLFNFQNKLGADVADAAFEIFIIDVAENIDGPFNLKLGAVKSGKAKYVGFDLPLACEQISRLHMNGFTSCRGDKDYLQECNERKEVSSKTKIPFGDEAQ